MSLLFQCPVVGQSKKSIGLIGSWLTRDSRLTWDHGWLMQRDNSFVDHTVGFFSGYSGCACNQEKLKSIPILHETQQLRLINVAPLNVVMNS